MQFNREKTLFMLQINHSVRDFLINSINGPYEKVSDRVFYPSSSQFLKMIIFSMSIITLQDLPILNMLILFIVELMVCATNIAAINQLKLTKNIILMVLRILQSLFLIPFILYYFSINIPGIAPSSGQISYLVMSLFFTSMILDAIHMIMIYSFIFQQTIFFLFKQKNKNTKMMKYNELSNQIIFYSPLIQNKKHNFRNKYKRVVPHLKIKTKKKSIKRLNYQYKVKNTDRLRLRIENNKIMLNRNKKCEFKSIRSANGRKKLTD